MIRLDFLEEMIELVIFSGYVKHEEPISLMIIGSPESAKTKVILKYAKNKGMKVLTDATAYGIRMEVMPYVRRGEIKHIMIPDFLKPTNKNPATVADFVSIMNALIEEGVGSISTYNQKMEDGDEKLARCGLITSITDELMKDKRRYGKWKNMGFLSRMIPISYAYTKETVEEVLGYIKRQEYRNEDESIILKLPDKITDVKLSEKYSGYIINKIKFIAEAQNRYGFRMARQFNTLMKASALKDGRTNVEKQDVIKIRKLLYWINFELREI